MKSQSRTERGLLAALMVAVLVVPIFAEAGIFDKLFDGNSKELPTRARYDRRPPQEFAAGTLSVGLTGRYQVGHLAVDLSDDTVIIKNGRELEARDLSLGQQVRVTGYRQDDGVVMATRISVVKPSTQLKLGSDSGMNQDVGEMPEGTPQ